jgi:hypothetical protein
MNPYRTVSDHIEELQAEFRRLSSSRKDALHREAWSFIAQNPGCADHSNFWNGLSARQVLAARHQETTNPYRTVSDHIEELQAAFWRLSSSRKAALRREARAFIYQHPGCADHSNFWRGLSARQVLACWYRS